MWFPNEIFSQIKDFMLDYKKTFRRNILPSIGVTKIIENSYCWTKIRSK